MPARLLCVSSVRRVIVFTCASSGKQTGVYNPLGSVPWESISEDALIPECWPEGIKFREPSRSTKPELMKILAHIFQRQEEGGTVPFGFNARPSKPCKKGELPALTEDVDKWEAYAIARVAIVAKGAHDENAEEEEDEGEGNGTEDEEEDEEVTATRKRRKTTTAAERKKREAKQNPSKATAAKKAPANQGAAKKAAAKKRKIAAVDEDEEPEAQETDEDDAPVAVVKSKPRGKDKGKGKGKAKEVPPPVEDENTAHLDGGDQPRPRVFPRKIAPSHITREMLLKANPTFGTRDEDWRSYIRNASGLPEWASLVEEVKDVMDLEVDVSCAFAFSVIF